MVDYLDTPRDFERDGIKRPLAAVKKNYIQYEEDEFNIRGNRSDLRIFNKIRFNFFLD